MDGQNESRTSAELSRLQEQVEQLLQTVQTLKQTVQTLKQTVQTLKQTVAQQQTENARLETENTRLREELRDCRQELQEYKDRDGQSPTERLAEAYSLRSEEQRQQERAGSKRRRKQKSPRRGRRQEKQEKGKQEKGTRLIVLRGCGGWPALMSRRPRVGPAGMCFHVLNRAVARLTLFEEDGDYAAFERVLGEAVARERLPIFAYAVMPNHWHFVVRPQTDSQLSDFFRWLTHSHTMRWHAHYHTEGTGHLYQGRFRTFPIEADEHLLTVLRYVELPSPSIAN